MIKRIFSPKHTTIHPVRAYRFNGTSFELRKPPVRQTLCAVITASLLVFTTATAGTGGRNSPEYRYVPTVHDRVAAYILKVNKKMQYNQAYELAQQVDKYAQQHKVSQNLTLAVIQHESHFAPNELSKAGAMGLCQVMPKAHLPLLLQAREVFGADTNIFTPEVNLWVCTKILRQYQAVYHGLDNALARFSGNTGTAGPYVQAVLGLKQRFDEEFSWQTRS